MFKALSDPTRLRIMHLLQLGPLCVGDLVTVLNVPQPKVSRHLSYLRKCGLVDDERRGLWMFYGLRKSSTPFHERLLEAVTASQDLVDQTWRDDATLKALQKKGGCCPQHQGPKRHGRS